jgi:hypothetical protein
LLPVQPIRYSDGAGAIYFSKFGGTMNTRSTRILSLAFAALILVLGNRPPSALAQVKAAAGTGTVYVSRPSAWAASALRINVLVNGKAVGSIGDGQCLKVTLPTGRHKVHGHVPSLLGQLFDTDTNSVQVNVTSDLPTFVSINPRVIFPSQNIVYPATVSSKGRSC